MTAFTLLFGKPLGTDDAVLHFHYAWTVYNHHLPEFFQRPELPIHGLFVPPVQWTSQHPPLYYWILAPFIGFPLSHHHLSTAAFAGSIVTAVMAFAALLFIPFFLNRWGVRSKNGLVIATLLAATMVRFIGVAGAVYNDSLAILMSVLSIGITGLVIVKGPTRKYLISLLVVVSLGMLTRASLFLNLALACAVVLVSTYFHKKRSEDHKYPLLIKSLVWPILIFVSALAVSAWYYVRNKSLTGSYLGGSSEWTRDHLHNMPHSMFSVLSDHVFFELPFHIFNDSEIVLFPIIGFLLFAFGVYYFVERSKSRKSLSTAYLGLMSVAYVLASWSLQAVYASRGGSTNSRYILPALLPLIYVMTMGACRLKRWGLLAVACVSIAGAVGSLSGIIGSYHGHFKLLSNGLLKLPVSNSEAMVMAVALLCLVVVGFTLAFSSLMVDNGSDHAKL